MSEIISCKQNDEKILEILESLAAEIWHEYYSPIIGKDQVEYMLEKFQSKKAIQDQIQEGFQYFMIRDNADYLGYIGVIEKEDHLFLSKIYIKSTYRGNGYGKSLVELAEKIAKNSNLDKITLTVNKDNLNSINAYKKLGFIITDSIVMDIGHGFVMDDFKMEKVLS